jgi:uncharacterized protein DUF3105
MPPKKSRTPPPPRRPVQAPKRREAPPTRSTQRTYAERRRWLVLGGAGAAVVALVVVLVVVFATGGAGASVQQDLAAAGCSYKTYVVHDRHHVASLNAKIKYPTFPAVGGPHYQAPMPFGRYPTPVVEIQKVHNLEHGAVVIQYGDKVPQATVAELTSFYASSPNAMLMAPLPALGKKIALEAWTADQGKLSDSTSGGYQGDARLALCTSFDEKAYKSFRSAYRGKGPERFPMSALAPGQ